MLVLFVLLLILNLYLIIFVLFGMFLIFLISLFVNSFRIILLLILRQIVLWLLLIYHLRELFSIDLLFLLLFFAVRLIYLRDLLLLLLIKFVLIALLRESFLLRYFSTFHEMPLLTHVEQYLRLLVIFRFLLVFWIVLLLSVLLINFTYCLIQFLSFRKFKLQDGVFLPLMLFIEL